MKTELMQLDVAAIAAGDDVRTTLMVKNIPNKYSQTMLIEAFAAVAGQFDFLYLPIDFSNRCNVGYAFINFTSHVWLAAAPWLVGSRSARAAAAHSGFLRGVSRSPVAKVQQRQDLRAGLRAHPGQAEPDYALSKLASAERRQKVPPDHLWRRHRRARYAGGGVARARSCGATRLVWHRCRFCAPWPGVRDNSDAWCAALVLTDRRRGSRSRGRK